MTFAAQLAQAKTEKRSNLHQYHRYFGKLIPAIPRAAILAYTSPGDRVLDPFCGSGTTVVEATLLGREGWGLDLNPLAVWLAQIKSTPLEPRPLALAWEEFRKALETPIPHWQARLPPLPNLDHWFRPPVQRDLVSALSACEQIPEPPVKEFFRGCISASLRSVSNADPRHIFPGYSKRMRELDAKGRSISLAQTLQRAIPRRMTAMAEYPRQRLPGQIRIGDAKGADQLPRPQLIVTNPPYISSIRYLETMKLELYWLGFLKGREEYWRLDQGVMGTERLYKREYATLLETGLPSLDDQIHRLYQQGQAKMARVVAQYFVQMEAVMAKLATTLLPGGHLVVKISDSHVRGEEIPTNQILQVLAERNGLELLEAFPDAIENRSLLTARNSYSGLITHDWILVWRRGA